MHYHFDVHLVSVVSMVVWFVLKAFKFVMANMDDSMDALYNTMLS